MSNSESPVWLNAFGQSDVGVVRENNEDSFLMADLSTGVVASDATAFSHAIGPKGSLLLVADGMGGAVAGEVASKMAADQVMRGISSQLSGMRHLNQRGFVRTLKQSVYDANSVVFDEAQSDKTLRGMGTTLTAAAVLGEFVYFAQLGDSRAYLARNGSIVQMTKDQSLVAQLIATGGLSPHEARTHPQRNVILQALGVQPKVDVVISFAQLKRGDQLVLCSDGLHGKVEAEEVNETLQRWATPADVCQRLIELARERGGEDNITVVVANFDGETLPLPGLMDRPEYKAFDGHQARRFWPWFWKP
jgi:serine/threonine protein phosphatase PrpC